MPTRKKPSDNRVRIKFLLRSYTPELIINSVKIVATIEARMKSSRLPGKVLLSANGKPMLDHLIRRLKAVPSLQDIVIATTTNPLDQPIVDFAYKSGVKVYRGSEEDVMARVIGAAKSAAADVIVEITGDCPIIDPKIVEEAIQLFIAHPEAKYVSNAEIRSYPDGMDVQVFPLAALEKSFTLTQDPLDHEHVSLHMRKNPQLFPPLHLIAPESLHWPELGLTLDEQGDYQLLKNIIEHFEDPLFSCESAIRYLRENPSLLSFNKAVLRKGDT